MGYYDRRQWRTAGSAVEGNWGGEDRYACGGRSDQ
jgi:hypothetical protein